MSIPTEYLEVVPAYGRDYKSQREVREAWEAGKDFQILSVGSHGTYVNKGDLPDGVKLEIRYAKRMKVIILP